MSEPKRYTSDPKGLYRKYAVFEAAGIGRTSPGNPILDCFVLRPQDPHARIALMAYAESVRAENPVLAQELTTWVAVHRKVDEEQPT